MNYKTQHWAKVLVMIFLVGGFLFWTSGLASAQTAKKSSEWKPQALTLLVHSVGGTGHASGTAVASAITDATGVKVSPIPSSKSLERTSILRSKKADIFHDVGASVHDRWYGVMELDSDGYGPQKIRALWVCGPLPIGAMTQKESGIKKVSDIKGKKIAQVPGYDMYNRYLWGVLAFADLTLKDVQIAKFPNYGMAGKSIPQRKADVSAQSTTSAAAYEAAASPGGLHWIPLPVENKAGWARLQEVCPFFFPYKATSGAGIAKENPLETMKQSYVFTAYPWLDDKIAYWFTKQLHVLYDKYKGMNKYMETWTLEESLALGAGVIPFHPGAIKYFKEIGRWTPEHEKWQQERLKKEKQLLADWKAKHPNWKSIPE
jgi:TRAP transporter TAXI family solute receptor